MDLFSQFTAQFKPKEEPKPEPEVKPQEEPDSRLVDRYYAYREANPEYISVKDFRLLEQREAAVEGLESMSEFEKKQRRLADKQRKEALTGQVEEEPLPHVAIKTYIEEGFAKIKSPVEFSPTISHVNCSPDITPETIEAINQVAEKALEMYSSMPIGQKEAQERNGVRDHGSGLYGDSENPKITVQEAEVEVEHLENVKLNTSLTPQDLLKRLQEQGLMYYDGQDITKTKIWVGVDPGKKGGIVAISDNGIVGKWVMPLLGDDIDAQGIWDILAELKTKHDITLVLEEVHSLFGMSASTNFSMGHTLGIILGIIVTSKIKLIRIAPKTWQKEVWNTSDMEYKPIKEGQKKASVDTKLTSMKAAHRLFPTADFRATTRSKNDHDGITDSVCLAEYARRKNL